MFDSSPATHRNVLAPTIRVAMLVLAGMLIISAVGCSSFAARGRNAAGVGFFQQDRFQEALQQFQEATYIDPKNPDGYYNLAATHHRVGLVQQDSEDLDRAEQYYHMCLDKHENHADCYRGLAVLLCEQGRKDDAFELLEGWADAQPTLAAPKNALARLCEEFGDPAAARQYLEDALKNEPDNRFALAALGRIHEQSGELEQALANYQRSQAAGAYHPQLATRISTLRSTIAPPVSINLPESARTRLVDRGASARR